MKKLLLVITVIVLSQFNINAQSCTTYAVQYNGSNHEWGVFNPLNANVTGVTSITTPISDYDDPNSCIDGQNEMIYFFEVTEVSGNGVSSIVSLNVNTGVTSKQTTTDGGMLEYSNTTGKLHVVQYDISNNYQIGELNPTTGAVSNVMTTTTPVGSVVGKSCLNEQDGNIYFIEENGANYTLFSFNLNSGSLIALNISNIPSGGEIWYIEHNNATGNTYIILTDASSWKIAQINTTTGALSNINTCSSVAAPPEGVSYMDDQNGIFYYTVSGSVVGVDINTNLGTVNSVTNDIYVLEHNNFACVVGVESYELENDIKTYPNPFTNQFDVTIANGSTIKNIRIYDITGLKVVEGNIVGNTVVINDKLQKGHYILEITTEKGKTIRKSIVKN